MRLLRYEKDYGEVKFIYNIHHQKLHTDIHLLKGPSLLLIIDLGEKWALEIQALFLFS